MEIAKNGLPWGPQITHFLGSMPLDPPRKSYSCPHTKKFSTNSVVYIATI